MNRLKNKSYLLIILLLINVVVLTACTNNKDEILEEQPIIKNIEIDENNAKVISISSLEIVNISSSKKNNLEISTNIENNSKFDIANIGFKYEELDKNKNKIADSKTFSGISLSSNDKASITFPHKEYTESIKITGYTYEVFDKKVYVNLKSDTVKIKDNPDIVENSVDYEVLSIPEDLKKIQSENGITYTIDVKNISNKDLGNVILKVAEKNENNEYIKVDNIPVNNIVKPSDNMKIEINPSNKSKDIEVIAYRYEDIRLKKEIEINFKSHQIKIEK